MLPDGVLSTVSVVGNFVGAKALNESVRLSYEDGGILLNDTSEGRKYQVWHCKIVGEDIVIGSDIVQDVVFLNVPNTTEVSITFDQNMQPMVAYVQAGEAKLYWYDATLSDYTTINLGNLVVSPKLVFDDARDSQILVGDAILGYINGTNLCYRQQRDRFTIEYVLKSGVNHRILKMGMNNQLRLQITVGNLIGTCGVQ